MDAKCFPAAPLNSFCSVSLCAGSQLDMRTMSPSECDQCVSECDVESCGINPENEQCTDRCLVVPCEEQCLDACDSCFDMPKPICDSNECQNFFTGADTGISAIPKANFTHPSNVEHGYPPLDWNPAPDDSLEAFLCACNNHDYPHHFRRGVCTRYCSPSQTAPNASYTTTSLLHPSSSLERTPTPSSPASVLFSPVLTSGSSLRSTPDISASSGLLMPSTSSTKFNIKSDVCADEQGDRCQWGKCGRLLPSSQDLASHLTTDHLNQYFGQHYGQPSDCLFPTDGPQVDIPCLWNNCNVYYPLVSPTAAGPSNLGHVSTETYFDLLRHIQQDHVEALPIPIEAVQISLNGDPCPDFGIGHASTLPSGTCISGSLGDKPELFCRWRDCPLANVPFASPADLTQHLTDAHVGMGNSRYHCHWADCHRHGESGFSSKQKILRHVQSHTGHRPFKCELCDQHFSEAATLQQHMRRHTKEKPFICPEPGCGKAFAIAGALTIHRRVHTGSKPFKCKFCDRSFSESSNLSKHIRTHTGDRPYSCNFPGCDKRFARPDQVARHRITHEKKK